MTKLLLVRHGEPTYEVVSKRNYKGHGRELGQLTEKGIEQAKAASKDPRLQGADVIISSPYTRALQTASILSRALDLDIIIENDIHEWVPDLTFNYEDGPEVYQAVQELLEYKGEHPKDKTCHWETLSSVAKRSITSMKKYLNYKKIIVVCHAVVMRQFKFQPLVDYCEILEVDFDENFEWKGWTEH